MRIVVNLDPLRRVGQLEAIRHALQQLVLRGALRLAAGEGGFGVGDGVIGQALLVAALRRLEIDGMAGSAGQRFAQQRRFVRHMAEQQQRRGRAFCVELRQERLHDFFDRGFRLVARKIRAGAEIAPGAEKEDLNGDMAAFLMRGDNVGVVDPGDMDILARLDGRQNLDAVAQFRGGFVIELVARLLHLLGEIPLQFAVLAGQERPRFVDLFAVLRRRDLADAGRGASLDVILQAWARARLEDIVRAIPQHEGALQMDHRLIDRQGRREGGRNTSRAAHAARDAWSRRENHDRR